jgi:hypothetical protein
MIVLPDRVSHYTYEAIMHYQKGEDALRSLNHDKVYAQAKIAIGAIAISTYIIANETEPEVVEALKWVDELPIPNGLYANLIEAVHVVEKKYFPLLNFAMSYPTSRKNLDLVEDAIEELIDNIKKNDESNEFEPLVKEWYQALGWD